MVGPKSWMSTLAQFQGQIDQSATVLQRAYLCLEFGSLYSYVPVGCEDYDTCHFNATS